jgi:hypothetical protein
VIPKEKEDGLLGMNIEIGISILIPYWFGILNFSLTLIPRYLDIKPGI